MTTVNFPTRRLFCGLLPGLALTLTGCGNSGAVSGAVRLNGKPLSSGRVTFTNPDKPGAAQYAWIGEDGSYKVTDCPPGPVQITVQTVGYRGARSAATPIPARYANPAASGLDYVVRPGRQQHDIDLTP